MTTSSKDETEKGYPSAEERIETTIGSWIGSLGEFEQLVENMKLNQLKRAIKAAYAHPLEHDKIQLLDNKEHTFLSLFSRRDNDKLNAALAQLEIQGQQLKTQENTNE